MALFSKLHCQLLEVLLNVNIMIHFQINYFKLFIDLISPSLSPSKVLSQVSREELLKSLSLGLKINPKFGKYILCIS